MPVAAKNKLTPKRWAFSKHVASGKVSLSDAYRLSYDAENMSDGAIRNEASKLMANPDVTRTVEQLRMAQDRVNIASGLSDRDRVLTKLRTLLENAEGTSAEAIMLKAADLLGKSCNLYRDTLQVEIHESASDIRLELEQRLKTISASINPPLIEYVDTDVDTED